MHDCNTLLWSGLLFFYILILWLNKCSCHSAGFSYITSYLFIFLTRQKSVPSFWFFWVVNIKQSWAWTLEAAVSLQTMSQLYTYSAFHNENQECNHMLEQGCPTGGLLSVMMWPATSCFGMADWQAQIAVADPPSQCISVVNADGGRGSKRLRSRAA